MFAVRLRMNLRIPLCVVCLATLSVVSFAQDIQTQAEAMMAHARQLSDIRSPNSPAFRLKATFSFVGADLETIQGTYTEVWASSSEWRRETVIGDVHHIEIGKLDKLWLLDPDGFPPTANKLPALIAVVPPSSRNFTFASITEHEMRNLKTECAESKAPAAHLSPFVFCFEKKSGMLLEKISPETRPVNSVTFSCAYGEFRKFGDYWFPRQVRCFEDRHKTISADVVELSLESPVDPAIFDAPKGSIELGQCSGKTVAPDPPTLSIMPPGLHLDHDAMIRVWFVVDTKGRAQNLKVLPPASSKLNESVLNWVRHWNFSPGKCDGKPMAMEMSMDVPSAAR
jgi:Gram-negative bacterial TonB protein C-terminal